jgi:hypothetical protein
LEPVGEQRRKEFLVRGHSHLDVMARIRAGLTQTNFKETSQSTETSVKFYQNPGFWRTLFGALNFVTVITIPVGEDTRLIILADVKDRRPDALIDQASNLIGREVALEEA